MVRLGLFEEVAFTESSKTRGKNYAKIGGIGLYVDGRAPAKTLRQESLVILRIKRKGVEHK